MKAPPLDGWIPIRLYWNEGQPLVDWCYLGSQRFTQPFFNDTITVCLRLPFNQMFRHQTPVATLLEWQRRRPGVAPTGFIFHMSRCGSTLAAQMLAAVPQNLVLSEAGPIDAVVRANTRDPQLSDAERCNWLRAMISALGQQRGDETRLFVKFDSWHILDLPLIRTAFPAVPWIFLYRDPVEVLASQVKQRALWLVPGMVGEMLPGVEKEETLRMMPEEYCARCLARVCQAALAHYRAGGTLVNYRQLPEAVYDSVADNFGLSWLPAELEAMRQATRFNAKTPGLVFAAESGDKQDAATDRIREMAATWLTPVYEQLEAVRRGQGE